LKDYSEDNMNPVAVRMRTQAKRVIVLVAGLKQLRMMASPKALDHIVTVLDRADNV